MKLYGTFDFKALKTGYSMEKIVMHLCGKHIEKGIQGADAIAAIHPSIIHSDLQETFFFFFLHRKPFSSTITKARSDVSEF